MNGGSAGQSLDTAARLVGTELGRLPAFAAGIGPELAFLVPPRLPGWTGLSASAVLLVGCLVAARRRDWSSALLGLFSVVVTLAAVFAVTHVRGLLFGYLVQWATVAGVLLWLTAGLVLIDVGQAAVRQEHGVARKPGRLVTVGLCVAVLWVTALVITGNTRLPENDPDSSRLAEAVSKWLPNKADVVAVDYLGTVRPTLVGATGEGAAFVLQLDRRHVRVQAPTAPELGFGPVRHTCPVQCDSSFGSALSATRCLRRLVSLRSLGLTLWSPTVPFRPVLDSAARRTGRVPSWRCADPARPALPENPRHGSAAGLSVT